MNPARALAAAIFAAGCSATGPSSTTLLGSFAAPLGDRTSYLAVQLYEDGDGFLAGRGWSSYSPSLMARVTVSGTRAGANLSLVIHPTPPFGLVDWRLDGTLAGDTLRGSFFFERSNAQQVELLRVASIPLGDYSLTLNGAVQDSAAGIAVFNYGGGNFRLVQLLNVPDRSLLVVRWNRRDLPAPATYALSSDGATGPAVEFTYNSEPGAADQEFQVLGGSIVLQQSARYVLAGRFDLNATDPAGRAVRLTGTVQRGLYGERVLGTGRVSGANIAPTTDSAAEAAM